MTKSKVFILAVIVFFIIMGGLYFLLPKEEKQGDVICLLYTSDAADEL